MESHKMRPLTIRYGKNIEFSYWYWNDENITWTLLLILEDILYYEQIEQIFDVDNFFLDQNKKKSTLGRSVKKVENGGS